MVLGSFYTSPLVGLCVSVKTRIQRLLKVTIRFLNFLELSRIKAISQNDEGVKLKVHFIDCIDLQTVQTSCLETDAPLRSARALQTGRGQ